MDSSLQDFLTFFHLNDLLTISSETSVSELLSLIIISFFAMVFCVLGVRVIMEFIKIFLDYRRLR